MKNPLLKKILPHFIAIVIFLIVSALFCKPVLDGNVLNQHDNIGWKGMAQNAFEYKEKTGHYPLWNPNLFSGMPNYQVAMQGKSVMPDMLKIFTLGTPKPINFFFLACICFYILCLVLRVRPIIGMLAAIAYAFSTYNPVIIAAGHDTQMQATALMPLILAGLISIYEKKYWLGFALTTYGAYQQIGVNHLQVTYYFFLIAALVTIPYLIKWIKEKDWKHIGIAGGITAVAALIGLAGNALILKTTSEYAKYTMRGGKDIAIDGDSVKAANTKGLDTAYAFEYSLGRAETMTMMMPNAFGGFSSNLIDENSKAVKKLTDRGYPENQILADLQNNRISKYWGKLYTSGPAYLGVIICLFGLIGFFTVKNPLRWGLLAATILGILMTWGKYLPGFNTFLFEHLPLYNKFRSPAFAQVIPQLTVGIMAAIAMQQVFFAEKGKELLKENLKKILYISGGFFGLLAIAYLVMDFSSPIDRLIVQGYTDKDGNSELGKLIVSGLKADRKAMFGGQLLRAIGLAALALAVVFAYYKKWLKGLVAAIILFVVSTLDITLTSNYYFSNDKGPYLNREQQLFIPAEDYDNTNFKKTEIDDQLLKDKDPNFRVFNMVGTENGGPFSESRTSYYHKSIGGYHPAKLRIYQDVIEKYLSAGRPNPGVLNMLNTKYIVVQDPQSRQTGIIPNPDALGNCWFVKNVQIVKDRVASIQATGNSNVKDTAIVDESFSKLVVQPAWDSASSIKMTKFDNDAIEYEANCNGPQFAVFSEIYYPAGWNAYLDGIKTDYCNVDYVLRGMSVPAGKHTIKFVFEPASAKKGPSIMFIASILILIIFLGGLYMHFKKEMQSLRKTQPGTHYPDVPA